MLARTAEVRPEQIAECRRFANLMPPPPDQCSGEMPGALGLFRGETIEYIIAKAFAGPGGWPQLQYVFAPSAVMRALLGNVRVFESFAKEPVPAFASQRTDLPRFVLDPPEPADPDTQADDLIALLGYCKNSLKVVEGLLAGLVQAMGLAIINAPLSLHDRLTFVQGLLTLLPGPARVGVSFATSVIDPGRTNTQIKFLASDLRPNRHLVYDWASGTLLTPPPADSYSKYILSQLRLDTSLVVQQTEKMARTAVWRAMRKDDLANALAWVSRRASLDSAVEQGLPAERKTVASVLREDPTLPDHLRLKYSQHLLKLTLALDEPGDADILPVIAVQNQDLASAIYEQLENAAKSEHAMAVYHLLGRWIAQPPMGVDVNRWRTLLSTATLTLATQRAEGDADALIAFLSQYLDVPPGLQLEGAVAQAIGICRKRAYDNPEVARAIFLLGAQYLPAGGLQRLLSDTRIVAQLPEAVQVALANLTPSHAAAAPVGVLMRAAQTFPPERQPIVLARLIEWATLIARIDLIDASALAGLLKIAGSSNAPRFDVMMQHVIDDMSPLEVVKTLDTRTQQFLVELSLVRGNFPQATRQLEFYQAQIYKGTPQEDLRALTYAVFRDVPLPIPKLIDALTGLNDSQLRPIARVSAYVGALESWNWSNELEPVMRRFTAITFSDPRIIAGIGIDPVLRLLKANIDRQDAMEAFRLAEAVVDFALTLDSALETTGVALVNRVFMQINA
ncbi:MAG TPA: hypothetical protein VMT34_06665, partial [Aggregatilineales bacterium]|nr:hypothetical protein [Aggregatilineales bacterium]